MLFMLEILKNKLKVAFHIQQSLNLPESTDPLGTPVHKLIQNTFFNYYGINI